MKTAVFALVSACSLVACTNAKTPTQDAHIVPLKNVRLYETGVGYFERQGVLGDGDGSALPVPAGHLDDALKTLVIIGKGTHIEALRFDSSVSPGVARARAGLGGEVTAPIAYRDVLASMKGERVEVTTSQGMLEGRVVDVADEALAPPTPLAPTKKKDGDKPAEEPPPRLDVALLVLGDDGEVRRLHPADFSGVRPLDPAFAARLSKLLSTTSSRAAQAVRLLHLASSAKEPVTFGYVAETPIWRSTYRLVFDADRKGGTLQGFALVHNDTDEAWRGVHLSLENGKPDSFLYPFAAPRYARRELKTPTEEMYTLPQLEGTTPDAMWSDGTSAPLDSLGHGSGTGSGYGFGSGHGRLGGSHSTSVGESSLLDVGNLAAGAQAAGTENGAIFSYSIATPLDLGPRSSALVPFVEQRVATRGITFFASSSAPARTAVRFSNGTGQTLPEGTLAFFGDGGFIGESVLERLKPGELRFIEFGTDLDVDLDDHFDKSTEEPQRAIFDAGGLHVHFLKTTKRTLTIESKSGAARSVFVGLSLVQNSKVDGADSTDFDPATRTPLAVFELPGKQKIVRQLVAVEGLERRSHIDSLTEKNLREVAAAPSLPQADRAVLLDAAAKQKDREETNKKIATEKKDKEVVEADLKRLREHLAALGDKQQGPNPIVARILAAEDKLAALRKLEDALDKEHETKKDAVAAALSKLAPAK